MDQRKLAGESVPNGPNPSRDAYDWLNVPAPTRREKRIRTDTICKMFSGTPNNRHLAGNITRQWKHESSNYNQWSYDTENTKRNGKYGNELVAPDAHTEQLDDTEPHNSRETQSENSPPSQ